ncbi:MAG: hypothetical protein ICV60_02545 [Pyrinomonadaceae bacterium]|nr:hypothetical protein [Pyrinomonadaceae bacterium]
MRSLSENDLVCQLHVSLHKEFDDEEFLTAELRGVVQGLVNSLGWLALMTSERSDWEPVLSLYTDDHFSNEIMSRREIVGRIENTSGLSYEMSNYALGVIEKSVDNETEVENSSAVEIEHIGVIKANEWPRYVIHLSDELKVSPPRTDNTLDMPTIPSFER